MPTTYKNEQIRERKKQAKDTEQKLISVVRKHIITSQINNVCDEQEMQLTDIKHNETEGEQW